MPWLPDDVWEAQKAERVAAQGNGGDGGGGKGGGGGGKAGWLPDHIWEAQKAERAAAKGAGKGGWQGGWQPRAQPVWQPMFAMGGGWGKGKGKGKSMKSFPPSQRVWVGSLAGGTTWKELQEHMDGAGKTKWCEVFENKGKGTGAVAFETDAEAANAIATLNGSVLKGSAIEVDGWTKKEEEAS
mmetsp:Transcript_31553/g.100498  ORF Transcript_31553/g.100498 Transcript_31553/m.100498 type:complete len:184 (-) Transcript_31553:123-674(-)